jgi:hypothetical protein
MAKATKVKSLAKYNGHSIKNNKSVDLGMVFAYEELPNYIKLIQFLNENISINVKVEDQESLALGTFMIKEIKVDHDGQGIIKFNSLMDHVEAQNINEIVGATFKVVFKAEIEEAGEDNE